MEIISTASDCSINNYIACKYKQKYHVLNKSAAAENIDGTEMLAALIEAFENIDIEFTDLCGVHVEEIDMMRRIFEQECRIDAVKVYLYAMEEHIKVFGEPSFKAIEYLEQHRYVLLWDGDINRFNKRIKSIRGKEAQHIIRLNLLKKELDEFRKRQSELPTAENGTQKQFISYINHLQKHGFQINYETTNMYQLGVMWSDYGEHCKMMMDEAMKAKQGVRR